jgi:ABC-type molybdenum transport system ATPase subunit/photorepair protein PhrA
VQELMERVGLDPHDVDRFPWQFSGGQERRIGISRAPARHPNLIICDEAVSALDASVQARILALLSDLQQGRADHPRRVGRPAAGVSAASGAAAEGARKERPSRDHA